MFPRCKQLLLLLISGFYFAYVSKFTRTVCEDTAEQATVVLDSGLDQISHSGWRQALVWSLDSVRLAFDLEKVSLITLSANNGAKRFWALNGRAC